MKYLVIAVAATSVALSTGVALAGGWGGSSHGNSYSGGLVNVSPAIGLGDLNLLNGTSILNGSALLSGNNVSGILNGIGLGNLASGGGMGITTDNSRNRASVRHRR